MSITINNLEAIINYALNNQASLIDFQNIVMPGLDNNANKIYLKVPALGSIVENNTDAIHIVDELKGLAHPEGRVLFVNVADKTEAEAELKVIDNALQRALNQEAIVKFSQTDENLQNANSNIEVETQDINLIGTDANLDGIVFA